MHIHQECSDNNIHRLTVPNGLIRPAIGRQHPTQSTDTLLALKSRIFGQAAIEVFLNLIHRQTVFAVIFLQRLGILLGALESEVKGA